MGAWKSRDGVVCDIFARACCAVDGHGELELDVDVGSDGGCERAGAFSMVFLSLVLAIVQLMNYYYVITD